ncbi:MAG: PilZ domain-containing protein [Deltaproteobacteria bacterium]|nr:PilZ domain-containing protein [Deltaproteobacteria bacterium]MBW1812745.1 PilZ domain-containing protein [Deltaproteobacteria bacterium]MBW1846317.1 PilZ domain-containing protein [Deltaproteobacteria bacterium]MBW1983582.1 PilZ domain-containing protein [Deltaproteobacteria bacterium]MBW2181028.1 PilZ domain-containing protein [Deltaproteobacteria bacterium]
MTESDKRVNSRVSSKNLISYVCMDENDKIVESGMGRTLNVSESGIMLETHNNINKNLNILLSIVLEETLIDIKGKIVHSKSIDKDKYNIGIQFVGLDDTSRLQMTKFIREFKSS